MEFNRTPYELTLYQNLEQFIVKIPHKVEKRHSLAKNAQFWFKRAHKSPKKAQKRGESDFFRQRGLAINFLLWKYNF